MKPVAGFSSCRHACLQERSCLVLSLRVGGSQPVIPVIGRPIELVTVVLFVNSVLCLIPGGIDKCERLAQDRFLPNVRFRTTNERLPALRSVREGTSSGCVFRTGSIVAVCHGGVWYGWIVPFENHGNRSFTQVSIGRNAPAASGVYGLSNAREWIYVGETDDIHGELLNHLRHPSALLRNHSPSGFTYELIARASRIARQHQLVCELGPVGNRQAEPPATQ